MFTSQPAPAGESAYADRLGKAGAAFNLGTSVHLQIYRFSCVNWSYIGDEYIQI